MPDLHMLRQSLNARLTELLQRASEIEDTLSDPGDPDWQENAQTVEDDETLATVGSLTKQEIQDIRLTLNRIENGTWGTCVSCGQAIDPERLAELPTTCHCSRCA
jgi:RNA polymerase-binding transcription factor DksA